MKTHKILVSVPTSLAKRDALHSVRVLLRGAFSGVTVRTVKGRNGTHKPAKVSVRWVKKVQAFRVYVSGRDLGHVFSKVKDAREFLRSRHPSLAKSADYSHA